MITEYYVSQDLANKLFQIGFPQDTPMSYVYGELQLTHQLLPEVLEDDCTVAAPSLSMVHKWLREVKNIYIDVASLSDLDPVEYGFMISTKGNVGTYAPEEFYTYYEEALVVGIDKAIEMLNL